MPDKAFKILTKKSLSESDFFKFTLGVKITGKRIDHKNNLLLDSSLGYLYICSRQQMFDSVVPDSSKRTYVLEHLVLILGIIGFNLFVLN